MKEPKAPDPRRSSAGGRRGGPRVTIQNVADRLGLSKFAVSRALSGKSGVGDATRRRVVRTAKAMGYERAEDEAGEQRQILFVRQENDPVASELRFKLMHGAELEGEKRGFTVVSRQAAHLAEAARLDPFVAGIILAVPRPAEWTAAALRFGLPVVSATYVPPLEPVDHVGASDWEASFAVARFLTELGHRRMAFVHGSTLPQGRAERFRGFRDGAATVAGATTDDIVFDEEIGFRNPFLHYLARGGKPTALFCAHDGIAVNVISELLRLGLRVPEDVSVVGFQDFAAATQISPRLTTVRTPHLEIGAMMVRCIAERLDGGCMVGYPPMRIGIIPEIVMRDSAGPAAGSADWAKRMSPPAGSGTAPATGKA